MQGRAVPEPVVEWRRKDSLWTADTVGQDRKDVLIQTAEARDERAGDSGDHRILPAVHIDLYLNSRSGIGFVEPVHRQHRRHEGFGWAHGGIEALYRKQELHTLKL